MTVRLLEPAQLELDEAIAWYAAQAPGLGESFLIEALRIFALIDKYPEAWSPISENARRCRFRRFPYGAVYSRVDGQMLIVAVAHLHRAPGYWRSRTGGAEDSGQDKKTNTP